MVDSRHSEMCDVRSADGEGGLEREHCSLPVYYAAIDMGGYHCYITLLYSDSSISSL